MRCGPCAPGRSCAGYCPWFTRLMWSLRRPLRALSACRGWCTPLMGIPGAVWRARGRGDGIGTSLLLAWLAYFSATVSVVRVIRGWLPVNFRTLQSFQFDATDMLQFMRVMGLGSRVLHLAALDAHRERDALHSLALTDPLTGLTNRRGLYVTLTSSLLRCDSHPPDHRLRPRSRGRHRRHGLAQSRGRRHVQRQAGWQVLPAAQQGRPRAGFRPIRGTSSENPRQTRLNGSSGRPAPARRNSP